MQLLLHSLDFVTVPLPVTSPKDAMEVSELHAFRGLKLRNSLGGNA
jgi:hypothetical protein